MYFAFEDRKIANPFVGHVLSNEWSSQYYVKESSSAVQPKEKDVEKVGKASKKGTPLSPVWKKALKSPRMMPKPSKMSMMSTGSFHCRY